MTLVGCAAKNIDNDFQLIGVEEGIVILSISHDNKWNQNTSNVIFFLSGDEKNLSFSSRQRSFFLEFYPSEFSEDFGRLYVVKLKEGIYNFFSWHFRFGDEIGAIYSLEEEKIPQELKFNVIGGDVNYLGNLHLQLVLEEQHDSPGVFNFLDGYPVVRDMSERDLSIFWSRYPGLKSHKVEKKLLPLGPWVRR